MLDFLCDKIKKKINGLDKSILYEIRIRAFGAVAVNYGGEYMSLGVSVDLNDMKDMVDKACSYSVYSHSKSLSQGYITTEFGERIGICGEFVYEKGEIVCVKNVTSLVIRIPHQIIGCAEKIIKLISGQQNVLILSPPGMGKTTILRDLSRLISDKLNKNVAVIDERRELADGANAFNLGKNTDKLIGIGKSDGIEFAIKNLKPDYIVLDELFSDVEFDSIVYATSCGIKLVCSVHASSPSDLKRKRAYRKYLGEGVFDYYVFIGNKTGEITRVYTAEEIKYA